MRPKRTVVGPPLSRPGIAPLAEAVSAALLETSYAHTRSYCVERRSRSRFLSYYRLVDVSLARHHVTTPRHLSVWRNVWL
nr:MAG TPA: hypothetical protein [Caudoviricetes sp.]